jgi:putative peptidoglycan lipid II flippase
MIRKLLNRQINSITTAAFLIALSSLISRFLGIFRDRILAGQFGAGDILDVYYAAFRIPDLIFNLLVLGALSAGFIPIFTSLIKNPLEKIKNFLGGEDCKEAWRLANNLLNILVLGLIALSLLGIIFAPWMMRIITPGFSTDKLMTAANLSRIMFLSPIFLGLSAVFGGILQSYKRFFVYSLSPILYNIGIIIGILYLVPILGVYGLAWGVVIGATLHLLVQLPTVYKLGFRYQFICNWHDKTLRKILTMMLPRTLSLAISQINLLVITIVASTLDSGSLAVFNLANNLQSFPIGIFGISFAVAAFPAISAVAFDREELVSSISSTVRQILFFIIPSTVLLVTLRAQIIRVIFGTGQFNWHDTIMTIDTLGFFAFSLFAQAIIPLVTRVFYARHDAKTPFYIGLFSVVLNIVLSFWLGRKFGVAGLALAFSLSSILNLIMLWLTLRWEIKNLDEIRIIISVMKFSAAAVLGGVAIQATKLFLAPFIDMDRLWGVLAQGLIAGLAGLLVYFGICFVLKSEELFYFWHGIKKRLSWVKSVPPEDQGEARGI